MRNKLIIAAFALMLTAFAVILALPADKESVEAENRAISTVPELTAQTVFSGEFASGFESFVNDTVGFRSFFTGLSKRIDDMKGFAIDAGKVISASKDMGTGTVLKQTLLLADQSIIEMFVKKPEQQQLYADAVNHYAEKLPENIRIFNMLIPTQLQFREPIYKNLQDDQAEAIKDIYELLDERVTTVDACGALEKHSDEYIYFRTDHHWTQLGAYYAYREFIKTAGGTAVNKDTFEKGSIKNYLGSLYGYINSDSADILPDSIEWFDVDKNKDITVTMHSLDENGQPQTYKGNLYEHDKLEYTFFFGSDHPIVEMTNSQLSDGKTLAVVKESYSNALAPWLIKSYHKVILVDPRLCMENFQTVLDAYSPDEVLITNYIFSTNFTDYCQMLTDLY